MGGHSVIGILGPVFATVAFIVTASFNALSAQGGNRLGIYTRTISNVSATFDLAVTPAGWTFSIWTIIYFWQAAILVYSFTLICRRLPLGEKGSYLYAEPQVIPPLFFAAYVFNMGFNVGWTLLFDRMIIDVSLAFIVMIPFTLYIALFLALRRLAAIGSELQNGGAAKDIWFHRVIIQNGIAIYAAWTSIASLLNVAIVTEYTGGASRSTSAWTALGILTMEIVIMFVGDVFLLDQHTRYVVMPYAVVVMALSGVLDRNWDSDRPTSSYVAGLLALGIALLIAKVFVVVWRSKNRPIVYTGCVHGSLTDTMLEKNGAQTPV